MAYQTMMLSDDVKTNILKCALTELSYKIPIEEAPQHDDDGSFVHITIHDSRVEVTKSSSTCAGRQEPVVMFLQAVCDSYPNAINGSYIIGLHDKYGDGQFMNILVFSKVNPNIKGQIMIPDLYAMMNYAGKLAIPDMIPFHNKKNKALFVGATTGNLDCAKNARLQLCDWASRNTDVVDSYISNIAQIDPETVYSYYPSARNFVKNMWADMSSQRTYQYLINVDGNTCAWDRLPWILASNSVCLKQKAPDVNWYYSLLQDKKHYIEYSNNEELRDIIASTSSDVAEYIIRNANNFAQTYLSREAHLLYTGHILYHWNEFIHRT